VKTSCTARLTAAFGPHASIHSLLLLKSSLSLCILFPIAVLSQRPIEPVDFSPIDGETYYLINQLSGLQVDLSNGSAAAGATVVVQNRSFTGLSQRWAFTRLSADEWAITNLASGLCLDSATTGSTTSTVQNPCSLTSGTQQWSLEATSNGYCTLTNKGTGLALDVVNSSSSAGTALDQTSTSSSPTQSQQWLLRPAFFRGADNALLEKQEADHISNSLPWWTDAGTALDVLQILKNHGVNMIRIRPTSVPPYQTFTPPSPSSAVPVTCSGNGCYAETDSADLDLAKRAKQLGMSVELTLFFDGASSNATPGAWSGFTLAQAQTAVYDYVRAELKAYRSAGVMPDMVTIGNEVDTGFFGSLASPTGSNFAPFAALQIQGLQAVLDASSDTSIGPAIPPPLRCIHITPAWNLTSFFGLVDGNSIPYDAVCQSYYPIYHGPLTAAQAAVSNPSNQPVEQSVLTTAATSLGKPIFLIEVGGHYENGFDSNDPWYPATVFGQRQFLIDLNSVLKGLPDNLGMGMDYWDAEGVNTSKPGGGFTNGDGSTDGTYLWNGLTLFDNADTSGTTESSATNYAAVLSGIDALGGKLDSTLAYKFVNFATGNILETPTTVSSGGAPLDTATSDGGASLYQQWTISSDGSGYLQIANVGLSQGNTTQVLDNNGSSTSGTSVVLNAETAGAGSQQWNLVTAGNGYYAIVNKSSGLVLAAAGSGAGTITQQSPMSTNVDWITPASQSQLWQVIPVHITAGSAASAPAATSTSLTSSAVTVNPGQSVMFTATVTSGSGTPAGTVNLLNGTSQLGSGTLNASGVATFIATVSPGSNSITAAYVGNTQFAASTSPAVTVLVPDFSLTANQSSLTVSPGGSGIISLTVIPVGNYSGSVTMGCTTTLAGVTCAFAPTSYTLNGSNTVQTGTLTVSASSSAAAMLQLPTNRHEDRSALAALFSAPSGLIVLLIAFHRRRVSRAPGTHQLLLLFALLTASAYLSSCGGSSGGGGGGGMQPVTGTVTITATGSSGNISRTVPLSVTIN
jgi:arabinogalactan endo-1,4-beta-galactosidase